jgi:hypothetical protein
MALALLPFVLYVELLWWKFGELIVDLQSAGCKGKPHICGYRHLIRETSGLPSSLKDQKNQDAPSNNINRSFTTGPATRCSSLP